MVAVLAPVTSGVLNLMVAMTSQLPVLPVGVIWAPKAASELFFSSLMVALVSYLVTLRMVGSELSNSTFSTSSLPNVHSSRELS